MTGTRPHSRARRIRARLQKAQRELPLLWGNERRADLRAFREAGPASVPADGAPRIILAAPAAGNIGDQALLEAVIETTPGPLVVLVRAAADVAIPRADADRVRLVEAPDLVYGTGAAHDADLASFIALLEGAASFWVIGADIMDGRYSLRASIRRATLAEGARMRGVDSRVLGFSWSGRPRLAARRAVTAASRAGVTMLLRDPVSAERARGDGMREVIEVADVVFCATAEADPPVAPPRRYAIVNASALVGRRIDQTIELARVIERLHALGLHVVILPHVQVSSADDVAVCRALAAAVPAVGTTLIDRILEPAQVRRLARGAEIVVTGRMHLAIMSLRHGVPAITLATQGKVEGLMDRLGTPELCIAPVVGFADAVIGVVDTSLPADSRTRASIAENLPDVIRSAFVNTAPSPHTVRSR